MILFRALRINGIFQFAFKLLLFMGGFNSLAIEFSAAQCNPQRVIVMVPGTLNSAVPGGGETNPYARVYFSRAIIETAQKYACHVHVISGLSWFGDFQANGNIVLKELKDWQARQPEIQGLPIEVVAHSAGGFYSLAAVSLNTFEGSTLKFSKLHLLSTPMGGVELANMLTRNPLVRKQMEVFFNKRYAGLDLRGLWQLQTSQVRDFFKGLSLPQNVEIHTYAGVQSAPNSFTSILDAAFLPPILEAFEFLAVGDGDGIVSLASALHQPELYSHEGEPFGNLRIHPEIKIPLDHIEQVWDAKYLKILGFQNTSYITDQQINFIESLLAPSHGDN